MDSIFGTLESTWHPKSAIAGRRDLFERFSEDVSIRFAANVVGVGDSVVFSMSSKLIGHFVREIMPLSKTRVRFSLVILQMSSRRRANWSWEMNRSTKSRGRRPYV